MNKKRQKKILVAECNVSGKWWSFEKLNDLIRHFHWYYKESLLYDQEGNELLQSKITETLRKYNEIEFHSKKNHPEHKEIFLFVRMVTLV